jgi:hypothetical protein
MMVMMNDARGKEGPLLLLSEFLAVGKRARQRKKKWALIQENKTQKKAGLTRVQLRLDSPMEKNH